MLRTNCCPVLIPLFFLIFTHSTLCRADSSFDTSSQDQDEKNLIVNEQLNLFEGSQIKEGDAEREFIPQQPTGTSGGRMFKELLNPGPSNNPQPKCPSQVKTRVHELDVGTEVFYYRYEEPAYLTIYNTTTSRITNAGPMLGYYANYAYRPADPNFFNNFLTNVYMLQVRYAGSRDLEYKGSGVIKDKHDDVLEFRGLIGKDYNIGADSRVTPYFGFGYRYLLDRGDGQISSTGNWDYDRKSHYYYLPLGGDAVINMPQDWAVDFNAEYDIFLQGWEKSYLSDGDQFTGLDIPNLTNHQDHGFGVRGSIKFIKKGSMVDFYVEPYIRFWDIDYSKAETLTIDGVTTVPLVEPRNSTTEVGTKFGILF